MTLPIGETKRNRAFTLIEILLCIIILGIVLAIAAPNFSKGYSKLQLNETADDLLTVSRWAQAMAIGQERIYALSFAEDRNSFCLVREKMPPNPDDHDDFEAVKGSLGKKHLVPGSIHMNVSIDRIKFYPDGTIDPVSIKLDSPERKIELSSSEVRGMLSKVSDE